VEERGQSPGGEMPISGTVIELIANIAFHR